MTNSKILLTICLLLIFSISNYAQKPFRVATTAANFLEIGYGSAATGMGDAHVSNVRGLSSIYWNPAGLGYMEKNEVSISVQPWFVNINTSMTGLAYVHPSLGTFAVGVLIMDFGKEEVTTVDLPNGTGENFDGFDLALSVSYGKKLADWFAFGATAKYITSKIWHETASAMAIDLGAIVNTNFFTWSDIPGDGLNIGMSISNYGTRLSYNGIDLKQSVDILPDEDGNFANVPSRFELDEWELPLIFRLGVSFHPYIDEIHKITVAVDALHPNNNSESVNLGAEYSLKIPTYGSVFLRGGYKGFLLDESEYGLSLGVGFMIDLFGNNTVKFDYSYREHKTLGGIYSYSLGYQF
ncbi:MAG: PorV/PorQ family protein [Bacteroidetes bacterium]|nr:PorV/PorQ family protein [Bacteroidota bacterium]MBU1113589.1 PorV/PorQ family protein [Bacteroidota bacterium]MBU1796965.1 PorV/PorQ family protein [Bacteroidota bacterium]